jgi:hypothetical protein
MVLESDCCGGGDGKGEPCGDSPKPFPLSSGHISCVFSEWILQTPEEGMNTGFFEKPEPRGRFGW